MRIWYVVAYLAFIVAEVVRGSVRVAAAAFGLSAGSTPSIVELPLRCRTDLEVTAMASSITITPGTLVLGTAAATATSPPTLFVHSMFGRSRREVLDGLEDMERRLLRATRGDDAAAAGRSGRSGRSGRATDGPSGPSEPSGPGAATLGVEP